MKTKQAKEESDKSVDEETTIEPKTRARKKASDIIEEEKNKAIQDEAKTSKETKKPAKPKAVVKKRPLGIRKTLRKRVVPPKDAVKNVIKQTVKRGRKPAVKSEPDNSQEKETVPLIPVSEIKKEPGEEPASNSRSSSPRTTGRRQRLSSDVVMMKSLLAESPSNLLLGSRTSPYSMRSERSSSPSIFEGKKLRSGNPRKAKTNLLNEVVMKQQKRRRRLLSDSKPGENSDATEECKKLKRGRSCSRDGSEISKCSDITESDLSLSETCNDADSKELDKKLDKPKTDLDIDVETNVQISTVDKVPSHNEPKLAETKIDAEPSRILNDKTKKSLSLKRSTSLDADNNNSNKKLENLNSEIEDKSLVKTENDTLIDARSRILTSMSKTFNSREVSKNIKKARRGKKTTAAPRTNPNQSKNCTRSSSVTDSIEDKHETLESLSQEINDLINNLDQEDADGTDTSISNVPENSMGLLTKPVSKFYGSSKPLGDNNSIVTETPTRDKDILLTNESTPSKNDDNENIRLHYEDDSDKNSESPKQEITYKCGNVASIDKLMDRLKVFEEFDKRRQRQESESGVMVTNDVVLIPKSGADIKPLKDIQAPRSPERPVEKENVLSCFENNSAISIVKRDHVRKSVDIDLPNSVTLIKRNSFSARKESTSSNHSKESDAISIFEKSLGKDVTLTEIRKSVEKPTMTQSAPVDLHQLAMLLPNPSQNIAGLDSHQISITTRNISEIKKNSADIQVIKRTPRDSLSRKSSESVLDDEKMATLEKIKSPQHQLNSSEISITPAPVAVKSPQAVAVETEALAPPIGNIAIPEPVIMTSQSAPEVLSLPAEITKLPDAEVQESKAISSEEPAKVEEPTKPVEPTKTEVLPKSEEPVKPEKEIPAIEKTITQTDIKKKEETPLPAATTEAKIPEQDKKEKIEPEVKKVGKIRISTENQPGPSNVLHETPESQKRKENVLRTLGLLTHKAAKEAKIEKLKEKERIYGFNALNKNKAVKSSGDYTGTLKTVIKLNRGTGDRDKKKYRSSLKMTFQKSKNRSGKPTPDVGEDTAEDDAYYTIERREGGGSAASDGAQRKTYSNRLNNHEDAVPEPVEPKETLNLVIPEKASSFSIHPDRLCMDQCFYCGGKFGLFDTPCHIAQMKSAERQKKVLDNEEKLTIDSCLCDACYRHVDRRANCPSYRKRPLVKPGAPDPPPARPTSTEKPPSPGGEESEEDSLTSAGVGAGEKGVAGTRPAACHTAGCARAGEHSIRRKWLIKMRPAVTRILHLEGDYPGLHTIPLCGEHYRALAPLMACVLCRRRVTKHHNVHSIHGCLELNPVLSALRIPVQFTSRPVLCKTCRDYCAALQRPHAEAPHATQYTHKLLQLYKVDTTEMEIDRTLSETMYKAEIMSDPNSEESKRKKQRTKSKQRKSDAEKPESESSDKTESSPEKDKPKDEEDKTNIEEDIESLISTNKILVPGAKQTEPVQQNDPDHDVFEFDAPMLPLDKKTELQYLLQKQNNPAQFLHKPNLTQKHKNKMPALTGITKPGHQQRIHDKNSKRLHKIGQAVAVKDRPSKECIEMFDVDKQREMSVFKNLTLNEECTIESIPNKKPADINTLKNKWQMSESFTQVKKNLSELSKKQDHKKGEGKYTNPVKRLETNPSISVRELFPGEEEMNLQCNVEFSNVRGVTPEGWEKCHSVIQYDPETKRLWNELQRPYGNQSSFLRHLIILEKYFRNGELVLSHNASTHAANYSDSVQSRLRAYDNAPPTRLKPAVNGKSLLKPDKCMPPPVTPKPKHKSVEKSKSKPLPPELIAINTTNTQGRKAIHNVLHNIQQLVKGVSASDPTEVATAPLPVSKPEPPKEKKEVNKDTPKKQKPTSKPWRPTLMPITAENLSRIAREPLQVAVDGRQLPSLVQVMSSGTRYHITLQDYNKMCVMRREKLQQLQDTTDKKKDDGTIVTEVQSSAMLGNGGTVVQNMLPDETDLQISSNAATILKNVGLKNITIAPIPAKTATVTSHTIAPSSPLIVTTQMKLPHLSSVTITGESLSPLTQSLPIVTTNMLMPKIPKSLTVIPQTVVASMPQVIIPSSLSVAPQSICVAPQSVSATPQSMSIVPQSMSIAPQSASVSSQPAPAQDGQRP